MKWKSKLSFLNMVFLSLVSFLLVSCGGESSNKYDTDKIEKNTYFIEYYKSVTMVYFLKEGFVNICKDLKSDREFAVDLENLDYKMGYRYKIEATKYDTSERTVLTVKKVIEKTFTPLPFNTSHILKYFKAKNIKDNEYQILGTLNIKILDDDIKSKFDDIIKRSNMIDIRSDNTEKFRLYFEFDYDKGSETINFIKLVNIEEIVK